MTAVAAPAPIRRRRLPALDAPVVRAGLALVASTGITSALGLLYWSLAAHRYPPAAIGATAALLAAMDVIAAVANLGLKTALIRFVPTMGRRAARVVAGAYALAGAVALVAALAFVAVHSRWFPELTLLSSGPGAAFFVVSTLLWVVFFLQDSVLVGLRRSAWVPVENAAFAVAKLVLLLALVAPLPTWGMYVSWCLPLAAVVAGVNLGAFRLLRRGDGQAEERRSVADLVRFSAGDYLASALWLGTMHVLPLLVLAIAGATANARYAIAWTIAYSLYLVVSAVGSALVAEGAHDPDALVANTRRAAGQAALIVVPGVAVVVVVAPWLLGLLGPGYAAQGTTLLRLVALSALPHLVTGLYVNLARARRAIRSVILTYAALGAGVVGLTALLVPRWGVTGAGAAWLLTQTALAAVLAVTGLRDLWIGRVPTPLLRALGRPVHAWSDRRGRQRAATVLPDVLAAAGLGGAGWQLIQVTGDQVVARVDGPGRAVVVKVAGPGAADAARGREADALTVLADAPEAARLTIAAPRLLAEGTTDGRHWTVETAVEGPTGRQALDRGLAPDALLRSGAVALADLHAVTGRSTIVGEALLAAWVDEPAALVAGACPDAAGDLARLAQDLRTALADQPVTLTWTHGDPAPANLVLDGEGRVHGLVDWEGARADRPPELDLVGLVLGIRAATATREVGEVAVDLVDRPWTEEEVGVLAAGPNPHLPRATLVVLAWLHHLAGCLAKSDAYAHHRTWLARNVAGPAAHLDLDRPPPAAAPASPAVAPGPVVAVPDPAGGADPGTASTAPRTAWRWAWAALPLGAAATWFLSLAPVDLRAMTDTGLVSVLPPVAVAAVLVLLASLAVVVTRRPPPGGVLTAHVAALVAVAFATPPVLYGTLRYSWAWKHVGIVDFLDRTGGVDPGIGELSIYHNWPGFFAGAHLLHELTGIDPVTLARWAPVVFLGATTAAVALLAASFTTDRRVIGLTAALFVVGDWVGQEYFSPQALAFLAYVVAVALTVRLADAGRRAAATLVAVALLVTTVAVSHQLTPAMLVVALVLLALLHHKTGWTLAVVAAVTTVAWALWGAATYVGPNLVDAVDGLGRPVANTQENLANASALSPGQALVTAAGRGTVALLGLLAAVGVLRRWRAGDRRKAPLVLLLAPGVLLLANSFGGEILFRVVLFALPMLAYFAAHALVDLPGTRRWPATAALAPFAALVLLAAGFGLAHFGKDGHYRFTPEEVAAATWLAETAPPGTLLVEGSRNYPTQFRNYERFRYVPLDREDGAVRREIAAAPVATMARWLSDPDDAAAYVLLTRSQQREAEALGLRPARLLPRLEAALRASPRFVVAYENRDAVVFTLASREGD